MRHLLSDVSGFERLVRSKPHLLLAADFDGMLCPISPAPDSVTTPKRTVEVLRALGSCKDTVVAIVTGRSLSDIMERLPLEGVYAGNHGLEITGCGLAFRHPQAEAGRDLLADICFGLELSVANWQGAYVENKGLTASVHYRHVDEPEHNTCILAIRSYMHRFDSVLGVRVAHKSVEIYPRINWGKSETVQYIREQLSLADSVCVSLADDKTDKSISAGFTDAAGVRVDFEGTSRASYYLDDCSEVLAVLELICEWRGAHQWVQ
jgi:trehalose 6-phosphate phosphatase